MGSTCRAEKEFILRRKDKNWDWVCVCVEKCTKGDNGPFRCADNRCL